MKIQQMRLDRKRIGPESRPLANIRHGVKAFVTDASARDVHAVLGHEFFVARQIDCRHGVLRPIAAPAPRSGENAEWPRQQMTRSAYLAFRQQLANVAARNVFSPQAHLGIVVYFEAHFFTEFAQLMNVARRFVPEVEVVPLMNFTRLQALLQNVVGELMRRHQRKVARKGKQQNRIDAGTSQKLKLFRQRSQQLQIVIGTQNARGMRLKRNHHRSRLRRPRAPHDLINHVPVSPMYPVKISNTDKSRPEGAGHVVEMVEGQHLNQISNSSFIPSYASCTPAGNVAFVASCDRSWQICVKNVRLGFTSSTTLSERSTVECVGCGWCRSASRNKMSRPRSFSSVPAGTSLWSVR